MKEKLQKDLLAEKLANIVSIILPKIVRRAIENSISISQENN
jgi:hypothetical protein